MHKDNKKTKKYFHIHTDNIFLHPTHERLLDWHVHYDVEHGMLLLHSQRGVPFVTKGCFQERCKGITQCIAQHMTNHGQWEQVQVDEQVHPPHCQLLAWLQDFLKTNGRRWLQWTQLWGCWMFLCILFLYAATQASAILFSQSKWGKSKLFGFINRSS